MTAAHTQGKQIESARSQIWQSLKKIKMSRPASREIEKEMPATERRRSKEVKQKWSSHLRFRSNYTEGAIAPVFPLKGGGWLLFDSVHGMQYRLTYIRVFFKSYFFINFTFIVNGLNKVMKLHFSLSQNDLAWNKLY